MVKSKNKCVVCTSKKGKRICKINFNALICPKCCATIRNPNCSGCTYFDEAEKYKLEKLKKTGFSELEPELSTEIIDLHDQALNLIELGLKAQAEKLLVKGLKKNPKNHLLNFAMAYFYFSKGEYNKSIKYYDKAIKEFPQYLDAWNNKLIAHKKLLDMQNTIICLRKIIEFAPELSDIKQNAKKFLKSLEENIETNSGISVDQYLLNCEVFNNAFSYMERGEYKLAINLYKEILISQETHVQSNGNLGLCYAFLGEKQKALKFLNRAIELDPDYRLAIDNKEEVLKMKEGEKLLGAVTSVDYYRENFNRDDVNSP